MNAIDELIQTAKVDKSRPNWRTTLSKPKQATFEPGKTYVARMQTSKGPVVIRLMPEVAPMHVTSFIYLSRMAQGGCPAGSGTGGPGYKFDGEFSPQVKHDKGGKLSMANAGPGTDGSQFFLTFVATPWLDGKHTIFGEVIEGMDVMKALEAAGSSGGAPKERLVIEKVTVEERA